MTPHSAQSYQRQTAPTSTVKQKVSVLGWAEHHSDLRQSESPWSTVLALSPQEYPAGPTQALPQLTTMHTLLWLPCTTDHLHLHKLRSCCFIPSPMPKMCNSPVLCMLVAVSLSWSPHLVEVVPAISYQGIVLDSLPWLIKLFGAGMEGKIEIWGKKNKSTVK